MNRPLPPANTLTRAQYSGWACCWCGTSLLKSGGVSAGRAQGRSGAHDLSTEVYECPPNAGCGLAPSPRTPAKAGSTRQGSPA